MFARSHFNRKEAGRGGMYLPFQWHLRKHKIGGSRSRLTQAKLRPYHQNHQSRKGEGMSHPPSKHEAPSSTPRTAYPHKKIIPKWRVPQLMKITSRRAAGRTVGSGYQCQIPYDILHRVYTMNATQSTDVHPHWQHSTVGRPHAKRFPSHQLTMRAQKSPPGCKMETTLSVIT
jgi:hypothetical protein